MSIRWRGSRTDTPNPLGMVFHALEELETSSQPGDMSDVHNLDGGFGGNSGQISEKSALF